MKKSSVLIIASAIILSSCGAITQMASSDGSQRFHDGIYKKTKIFEKDSLQQLLNGKTPLEQARIYNDFVQRKKRLRTARLQTPWSKRPRPLRFTFSETRKTQWLSLRTWRH